MKSPKAVLGCECLEARETPAVYNVVLDTWNVGTPGTLPWAVNQANANLGLDSILIAPRNINATTNNLVITDDVVIDGNLVVNGVNTRSILTNSTGVVFNLPADPTVRTDVRGMNFKGNLGAFGGAVELVRDDVYFTDVTFDTNASTVRGGAVYIRPEATGTFSGVTFTDNFVPANEKGGAIYNQGTLLIGGSELNQTKFIRNQATSVMGQGDGGAIYNNGGAVTITGTTAKPVLFQNNSADRYGGAVASVGGPSLGFDWATLVDNKAIGGTGGAVYVDTTPTLIHNSVAQNNISDVGGAIYFRSAGPNPATLTITTSQFIGNSASTSGGAIYIQDASASIHDSSFQSNTAASGNAIYISTTSFLTLGRTFFFGSNSVKNLGTVVEDDTNFWLTYEP